MKARQEVSKATSGQYRGASKKEKGKLLDQFIATTGNGVGNRISVTASIPGATSLNGTTGYSYDSKTNSGRRPQRAMADQIIRAGRSEIQPVTA